MILLSRADRSIVGQWWWTVDRALILAFLALAMFGIVLVAAAGPPVALRIGLAQHYFIIRHMIVMVPALFLMFAMSFLSPQAIWRGCALVLGFSLLGMGWVLLTGSEIKGAQRWIHLPGFSLQPSEFVKPSLIVVSAWLMSRPKTEKSHMNLWICSGLYGLTITLLLMQPDVGMTFVVTCVLLTQLFLAGLPFRYIVTLGTIGLAGLVTLYFTFDHFHARIQRFLDPVNNGNYQVQKSLEAFTSGGLFGTGPGQGNVKLSLPDAHADFIFAVAGEELGLFLVLIIIALFVYVLIRGFNRVMEGQDLFPLVAASGLLTMFGLQAVIHMGSSLSLLPTKGMTLPFISYGGSSLLSTGLAMGCVLALTRRQSKQTSRGGSRHER